MIIVLIIYVILLLISAKIYINTGQKDINNILNKEELNKLTIDLPDNISICTEVLKDLEVKDISIKLNEDKKSTTSFYNVFSKQIILCDNVKVSKSFARILFIAHECVHASQKESHLKFNFILANINVAFCIISTILIWCNVITEHLYLTVFGIALILNLFSFFARNAIESSATYMSIIKATNYLRKYIEKENLELVEREYERIINKGYTTFIFSTFTTNIILILLQIISITVCTYIYT